jgi:hypothetical protein
VEENPIGGRTMPAGSDAKYLVAQIRGGDVAAISGPAGADAGPPVWNTDVLVESADDAAARVRGAGGDVRALRRLRRRADPQGAEFTASQFVPESRDGGS